MKRQYSIVETDNFGGDYPNESFLIRHIREEAAKQIADIVNKEMDAANGGSRFWKVVKDSYRTPYKLQPGFEP